MKGAVGFRDAVLEACDEEASSLWSLRFCFLLGCRGLLDDLLRKCFLLLACNLSLQKII